MNGLFAPASLIIAVIVIASLVYAIKLYREGRLLQETVEMLKTIVLAAILALIIRSHIVEAYQIPSSSMVPTLKIGDRLIVNKFIYQFKEPKNFDIVVFQPPPEVSDDKIFIKRLIGLPGDIVEVRNSKLYLNGKLINESYLNGPMNYTMPPIRVPKDKLFVMGDNRNRSFDSHLWGMLPERNLLGKAVMRYYPFNHVGILK